MCRPTPLSAVIRPSISFPGAAIRPCCPGCPTWSVGYDGWSGQLAGLWADRRARRAKTRPSGALRAVYDRLEPASWRCGKQQGRRNERCPGPIRWMYATASWRRCDAGRASRVVARQYRVSRAWVDRLKQRRRETGEVGAASGAPLQAPSVSGAHGAATGAGGGPARPALGRAAPRPRGLVQPRLGVAGATAGGPPVKKKSCSLRTRPGLRCSSRASAGGQLRPP